MNTVDILGVPVAAVNLPDAADRIETWIREEPRRYVTVTGVHGIMESVYDPEVRRAHRRAGMCVPDGMPTVWIGLLAGHRGMGRVYGPDLMLELMARSAGAGHRHFFFGGKEGVAERLRDRMVARFPELNVVGTYSPPFRPMTLEEEAGLEAELERLAPDILWVGLSTPKQERWMAAQVGRINAKVLIGVGAAFDIHAGLLRQAPRWMRRSGLEWFFRLCVEPRRLWRRYLVNNPLFILLMLGQWAGFRIGGAPRDDEERMGHAG
ncbi:MAG: WecB/TagA/CpsF family glycosyltransferase [FCB group bacterium]|jgi:N-acetylglucosaminyldiphosphoundecaprenol N-acetyl-beta-D-mannosaminyltransferase|nr:WecB/TagA/CpsF family glycosyltransferase [FCB group bacterium]